MDGWMRWKFGNPNFKEWHFGDGQRLRSLLCFLVWMHKVNIFLTKQLCTMSLMFSGLNSQSEHILNKTILHNSMKAVILNIGMLANSCWGYATSWFLVFFCWLYFCCVSSGWAFCSHYSFRVRIESMDSEKIWKFMDGRSSPFTISISPRDYSRLILKILGRNQLGCMWILECMYPMRLLIFLDKSVAVFLFRRLFHWSDCQNLGGSVCHRPIYICCRDQDKDWG